MSKTVKGAFAGFVGVVAMAGFITTLRRILLTSEQLATYQTHPEKIVVRLNELAGREELDGRTRRRLGDLIHFGYGALWGAIYNHMRKTTNPGMAAGLALAGGLWLFGFNVLLPAIGAHPGTWKWQRREFILTGSAHAAYGIATTFTIRLLETENHAE